MFACNKSSFAFWNFSKIFKYFQSVFGRIWGCRTCRYGGPTVLDSNRHSKLYLVVLFDTKKNKKITTVLSLINLPYHLNLLLLYFQAYWDIIYTQQKNLAFEGTVQWIRQDHITMTPVGIQSMYPQKFLHAFLWVPFHSLIPENH